MAEEIRIPIEGYDMMIETCIRLGYRPDVFVLGDTVIFRFEEPVPIDEEAINAVYDEIVKSED